MSKKFYGIDIHKKYSTISILNINGEEIEFINRCTDLKSFIEKRMGKNDYVVIESATSSFYYSDLIESQGASCFIINPYKFKIIRDSWKKTDKHDARNLAKALWIFCATKQFGLPTVYKPDRVTRELRRLFSNYDFLTKQITSIKNYVQSIFTDNGIILTSNEKKLLFKNNEEGLKIFNNTDLTDASYICIKQNLEILQFLIENKKKLTKEIYFAGEPLKSQVELLITIKGMTPLLALAFLADVGDITRFKKLKQLNAYLGVVPKVHSSGGKTYNGHINRESRKLTRTLCTQSIYHVANSSEYLNDFYTNLKKNKGAGKARIALIRKLIGIMRRMLLNGEKYKWIIVDNHERKQKQYHRDLEKIKESKKCA